MTTTKIEWADAVWNPLVGCTVHSPGCTNCYAMKMAYRLEAMAKEQMMLRDSPLAHYCGTTRKVKGNAVWTGQVNLAPESTLLAPLRRKKPTRYFVNSMSDLFHESVPDEWIDRTIAVMALCPQHTFQVLTKRSDRMRKYFSDLDERMMMIGMGAATLLDGDWIWNDGKRFRQQIEAVVDWGHGVDFEGNIDRSRDYLLPLPNVWLGVSVEDQTRAGERIPDLLATPAAVRFISAEPLLSKVDLSKWVYDRSRESLSCPSGTESIQRGRGRENLAARPMEGRGSTLATIHAKGARGAERGSVGQLSESDVRGRHGAAKSCGAPDRLDGCQPSPDTGPNGNQSHQRAEAGQPSGEPGIGDTAAECSTLPFNVESCEEGSSGREQHFRETDLRNGRRDSRPLGGEGNDAARNEDVFQGLAANNFRHRSAQDLETPALDWVICGGESGKSARPMHPDWARSLRDQCAAAAVPFFFKQWGEWAPADTISAGRAAGLRPFGFPDSTMPSYRIGKKAAGRLLDGAEHNAIPGSPA